MFYNINCSSIHIFGAKLQNYFDMCKFFCNFAAFFKSFLKNECILWQKS